VRVTVAVEDYEHQHQDLRTEDGVKYGDTVDELDFDYLTRASVLNVRALHHLAMAPMPPRVTADGAVRTDTKVSWQTPDGGEFYWVFLRRTDEANWGDYPNLNQIVVSEGAPRELDTRVRVRGDDWLFGVSACNGDYCSPVSSAVPGGPFEPVAKDEE
jgi:hypothetical protein